MRLVRFLLPAWATLALQFLIMPATAQQIELTPTRSHEGLATAQSHAKQHLDSDAVLVLIGAPGNARYATESFEVTLTFDQDSGTASAWGYIFYSPSRRLHTTVGAFHIPFVGWQATPVESPVQAPAEITRKLDIDLPFAHSDKFIERLKTNEVYKGYRKDLPEAGPAVVSFRDIIAGDPLPSNFPLDAAVWSARFDGAGDSTMICYVSGKTGETYCLRAMATSVVANESVVMGRARAVLLSCDATGARVLLPASGKSQFDAPPTVELFNVVGERLLSANELDRYDGGWIAEFDLSTLPMGTYYCQAKGDGWNGETLVITK